MICREGRPAGGAQGGTRGVALFWKTNAANSEEAVASDGSDFAGKSGRKCFSSLPLSACAAPLWALHTVSSKATCGGGQPGTLK